MIWVLRLQACSWLGGDGQAYMGDVPKSLKRIFKTLGTMQVDEDCLCRPSVGPKGVGFGQPSGTSQHKGISEDLPRFHCEKGCSQQLSKKAIQGRKFPISRLSVQLVAGCGR